MNSTKLQWITHASCLIYHNDYFLNTDPWYYKKAFTSWTVKPPPIINPKLMIDLTKTGKFPLTKLMMSSASSMLKN